MSEAFLVSDTHFGHGNICRFKRDDGTDLRPWDDVFEMEEALVERWNSAVSPSDKVYHLGDVAIPRRGLKVLERLNGRKILIRGNHDIFKLSDYTEYFADVRGCHYLEHCILTHIPVHPVNLTRYKANIHGHLHYRVVPDERTGLPDLRYYNVCVEHIDYTPISWNVVRKQLQDHDIM